MTSRADASQTRTSPYVAYATSTSAELRQAKITRHFQNTLSAANCQPPLSTSISRAAYASTPSRRPVCLSMHTHWPTYYHPRSRPQTLRQRSQRRPDAGLRAVTGHRPGRSPHFSRRPHHGPHAFAGRETPPCPADPRRPIQRRAIDRRSPILTVDRRCVVDWKTSRMVAHYSAGATAERGAVARYL